MIDYNAQDNIAIVAQEKTKMTQIFVHDVMYVHCDTYITDLYLCNNEIYTLSQSLKALEAQLHPYGFVRISKNTLINMRYVKMCCCEDRKIQLTNEKIFTASKTGWHHVKNFFCA